jgi:glutathione S-transferase
MLGSNELPTDAVGKNENFPQQDFPEETRKCTFYDMTHSNNAARIRIWIRLKGGLEDQVHIVMVGHQELHEGFLQAINPLKKVPAFVTDSGLKLFESFVILQYLEDRFGSTTLPSLVLDTPDDRAFVNLLVRCHDLYISSPNCTQPNFSHTQGCMYLDPVPTEFTPASRTMDVGTRAAKLAEIHKQLTWLESQIRLPFLAGERITHADCTWFPSCIFMELLLPLVFDWSPVFYETVHFPKLTIWFAKCLENDHFALTRKEIYGALEQHRQKGRFVKVREVAQNNPDYKWTYI